jgi:hypothetical protein
MGRIFRKPVQGCRASGNSTGVGRVVQHLELSKLGSPCTRSIYDGGFDVDCVDIDHWGEIRGRSIGPALAADEWYSI